MGSENNLYVGVQLYNEVNKPLLPLNVQRHLGLVHEEHVGLPVLHQDGQQNGQHLLLTRRQLVGHQRLANLREAYLVLRAHYLLAGLLEQVVHQVLKALLRLRQLLGSLSVALLQLADDAVAYVHLIVQVLTLQVVQLEVQSRPYARIHHVQRLVVKHGRVQRADDVVTHMGGIRGNGRNVHPLEQVVLQVTIGADAAEHLVQYGRLAHAVDAAKDVHMRVELPYNVLLAAPKSVYLYLPNIVCVLHSFASY